MAEGKESEILLRAVINNPNRVEARDCFTNPKNSRRKALHNQSNSHGIGPQFRVEYCRLVTGRVSKYRTVLVSSYK